MFSQRRRDRHSSPVGVPSMAQQAPVRTPMSLVERVECAAIAFAICLVIAMLILVPSFARADGHGGHGVYFGAQGGVARYFDDTDACSEIIEEIDEAVAGEEDTRITGAVATLLAGSECDVDDRGTAFRIFGGYRFSNWFALEAALTDLGKVSADLAGNTLVEGVNVDAEGSVELKVRGINLSAVLTAPVSERIDLFGRVGVLAWDADATARAGGTLSLAGQSLTFDDVTESASDSGADLVYGIGIRVGFTENVRLRAEINRYEAVDVDVGWIGVEFRP